MKIIPVIHMLNYNQVETNIKTCLECGVDSVFLINHQVSALELINCGLKMQNLFPDLWIGVNLLTVGIDVVGGLNVW